MEKYDCARLIDDTEELKSKNIFKGYLGDLISYISPSDEWIVMFTSPFYYGEFAVVKVKASNLKYAYTPRDSFTQEILERPDFYTHTSLRPPKFKEYDHVRLIVDRPEYSRKAYIKVTTAALCFHTLTATDGTFFFQNTVQVKILPKSWFARMTWNL